VKDSRTPKVFRDQKVQVLVNVAKLTHGVYIPGVETIVLCRPTMSDRLFSQMIGRGAEKGC